MVEGLKVEIAALKLQLIQQRAVSLNFTREKHGYAYDDTWKPQLLHTSIFGESHGV